MTYLIRTSNQNDTNIIVNFNKELEKHGFKFFLPVPDPKIVNTNDFILKNNHILIENDITVRAGYTLKSQWFQVNDELLQIGYYYQPVSAALFNKKYNICGVLLLNDAQKKHPYLFSLGMGGYSKPLPKLLKSLNWKLNKVPFFFKIFNPNPFLKNIKYLKKTKTKSFFINLMLFTGLGWLFIKFFFQFLSLFNIQIKKIENLEVQEIELFDQDFDEVWDDSKQYKSFSAVRNCKYLKTLYSDKKFIKLKFAKNNKIVGWSISLCNKLNNHDYFGNMKLGSIVDCLCLKSYETNIVRQTLEILKNRSADLIVSNQSHIFWKNAFKKNSFINGPSNYIFASSKLLSDRLMKDKKLENYVHLTRGDGDGPINL